MEAQTWFLFGLSITQTGNSTHFFTKENITAIVACLSLALSLFNLIRELLKSRRNVELRVMDAFRFESDDRTSEIISVQFINKSREAVSISQLELQCGDNRDDFGRYKKRLLESTSRTGGLITESKKWTADVLPIKLDSLGAVSVLLVSSGDKRVITPGNVCQATMITNKGPIKSKLTISAFDNQEKPKQCRAPD